MTQHNLSIEQLQGYIDQIKKALKETKEAESKILEILQRKELTEKEAHHVVGQLITTSVYIEKLKANREELVKIREDYFNGGKDGK